MIKSCGSILVLLLVLCLAGCTKEESRTVKRMGRINDFANVLSKDTQISLSSELEQYEEETCHQMFVLIVQSLKGETIKELSTRTALSWEIGHPSLDNGILLSIAIDEGQARIETGLSLESIIEQGMAERILKNDMFPLFRAQEIDRGVVQGVRAIMEEARKLEFSEELRPSICR